MVGNELERMARIKTKYTGIYYRNSKTNGKPDKTYYITYKDNTNKMVELKIGKFSEGVREAYCNAKRNEIVTKIRLGEVLPTIASKKRITAISVDDISKIYFEYRELHNGKGAKVEQYRYNSHIKPYFGTMDIARVTIKDIEKLQREKSKTLAPKTVNHILTLFSTIYNHCNLKEIAKIENPILKVKKLKVDNQRERYLNLEEIKLLIDEVRDNELIYLFCLLSLSTGGRATTIINIQKKHINLGSRTITLKDYKNDTTYNGFITDDIADIIKNKLDILNANDYILQIANKKISISQIQKRLKPILDDLFNQGLDKNDSKNRTVVHTLRHSFASNLAIKGTPIYTIQKLLNHKDINMTLRYAKLAPDSGKDMVDTVMDGII